MVQHPLIEDWGCKGGLRVPLAAQSITTPILGIVQNETKRGNA
jgi:hypothetical protein